MRDSLRILVVLVTVGGTTVSQPRAVRAEDTTEKERARRAYERGQAHYDVGEYDEAIAGFKEAYELSRAPLLLFNIAQAHRLKEDCVKALGVYRHFVRLAPDAPRSKDAEKHIEALSSRCETQPAAAAAAPEGAPRLVQPAAQPTEPAPAPTTTSDSRAPRRGLAMGLLAGGVALGVTTGLVYHWNHGRWSDWAREDRRLSAIGSDDPRGDDAIVRQHANDDLLRSIHRWDTTTVVLGAASAACFAGAALALLFPGETTVAAAPGTIHLAWRTSW